MNTYTKKSFKEKWTQNSSLAFDNTLDPTSDINRWIVKRNGFRDLEDFKQHLSNKKRILDAGCGNGRVTALLQSISPADTKIVGVDFSSFEVAKENLAKLKNVSIFQADLLESLSSLGTFDFIYCQEVLHHTTDPFKGFQNLCDILRPKGEIAIYVYKKKAPTREFVDEHIRELIYRKDYDKAMEECRKITELGKVLAELKITVNVPEIETLEIKAGEYDLQRFIYHYFMKCFWNEELSFEENAAINYDWYHPQLCSKHTIQEIRNWYHQLDIDILHETEDYYGITIRGNKKR